MEFWQVKAIRKYLKLTQAQFAKELGVSFVSVNRWEKSRFRPSPIADKMIRAYATSKGIDVDHWHPRLIRKTTRWAEMVTLLPGKESEKESGKESDKVSEKDEDWASFLRRLPSFYQGS